MSRMACRFAATAWFLLLPWIPFVAAVDLTVTPRATGSEVVEATVQRVMQSDIFSNDFSLLRRIALVETADGTDSAAFAGGLAGGIWRLSEDAFAKTQELTHGGEWESYYLNIQRSVFNIDWGNVTYQDLRTPLTSALAARIYVMLTTEPADSIPYGLPEQAAYWRTHYSGGGDEAEFVDKVTESEQQEVCAVGLDVVFALDASLSVGDEGFARSKNFVKEVVEAFNIGPRDDQTRVGCLQFSHKVTAAFDLGDHDNKESVLRAVDEIEYLGGGTAMGTAIDFIRQSSFAEERGARPLDYAVPRIAVILTDGKTNKEFPILFPSALAHRDGITIYSVGVGDADVGELSVIATRPIASHVLHVLDYKTIDYIKNIMATRTCKETTAVALGQPILTDLEEGEARFVSYEVDATEGATLKFMTSSGAVTVYLSSEVPNPNEAVHDYKLQTDGRADLFIDPAVLGGQTATRRAKRAAAGAAPAVPSHITVFASIHSQGNGTQLYVESSTGNTADPGFPPRTPIGTATTPPRGNVEHSGQRSHAPPAPKGPGTVGLAVLFAAALVCAQLLP